MGQNIYCYGNVIFADKSKKRIMKYIGAHVSASGGVEFAPVNAHEIGANAFALFTKNQRQWVSKPLTEDSIRLFKENCEKFGFAPEYILPHDSYLINLGHPEEEGLTKSRAAFLDEMQRCEQLGLKLLNFHPGSHVKQGVDVGIDYIVQMLNNILQPEQTTKVLLETMAGKGSEIGRNFNELKDILDRVELSDKMGVCLDTCHIWDGGYNVVDNLDEVIDEFDRIIGLDKLYAIHLNDSKNDRESHKDRHETIGNGYLGIEAIGKIINHPQLKHLPFELETPNDLNGYAKEIEILRGLYRE